MRMLSKLIVAGVATVALAGTAMAAEHAMHTMKVALPDGSVARINYVGDHAPQVRIVPVATRQMVPVAMVDPGFADIDRMFAAMDAQADAMMQQAAAMSRMPAMPAAPLQHADMQKLPAGMVSYSYVSTTSSNGCTQTVRMTSNGSADAQPKVIRTSAGKCDGAKMQPAVTDAKAAPKPAPAVDTKPQPKPFDPNSI